MRQHCNESIVRKQILKSHLFHPYFFFLSFVRIRHILLLFYRMSRLPCTWVWTISHIFFFFLLLLFIFYATCASYTHSFIIFHFFSAFPFAIWTFTKKKKRKSKMKYKTICDNRTFPRAGPSRNMNVCKQHRRENLMLSKKVVYLKTEKVVSHMLLSALVITSGCVK